VGMNVMRRNDDAMKRNAGNHKIEILDRLSLND
jgi:hypothetical protein